MEWLERMNKALDYIEDHLTGEIELSEAARMACCSSYHFQRMFSFITNVTLAEYIRRRRLTLAALDLQQNQSVKVIDIALKYGYDSPVSFARAFQALHGITPNMTRQENVEKKAYPRLSFLITIRGAEAMNYRLEHRESFEVFGIEGIFQTDYEESGSYSPAKLWEDSHANGDVELLGARAGAALPSFVSKHLYPVNAVCSYRKVDENQFSYMLCAFKEDDRDTDGYTSVTIPAYTWAIFPSELHTWEQFGETISTLYRRFYTEWLPTSGYVQMDGIVFEMNGEKDEQHFIELWFAVQKI